jgi:hypothetical protein
MIANLENIQLIYNDYPNTWLVDGVRIDNYKQSNDHFLNGWRDVVIPEITNLQKLSDTYILVNDIVTKEVIDFTTEEIEAYNRSLIPKQVHNHKLRLALIHFGIMPSQIDAAIEAMTDLTMREKIYTLWNFAPMLERADTSLNYMATQFEISQPNLDQIFIYANTLQ